MNRSRALRVGLTILVIGVVGYFFTTALARNWDAVRDIDVVVNGWSVASVITFALAVVCSGLLWGSLITHLGDVPVGRLEAIRVHCASWLLKYVPGQVGSVANKVAWGTRRGISRTLVVISFVYENVFLLLGSIVPSVIILAFVDGIGDGDELWQQVLPGVLAAVPLLLVMDRRLFHRAVGLVGRRVLKQPVPPQYFLSPLAALGYQAAFLGPRVLNGIGFLMVAVTIVDVPVSAYVPLAAGYVLAGAIGILAVFVPSGLGVREGVIVLVAANYMPVEQAIVLSLVTRLFSTAADVVVAGIYALLKGQAKLEERSS